MLNLRKKTLALAVTAAAAVGGGIPMVQAQTVAANGLGQALIYPYYSVREGWRTFIHITNTSTDTVVVKVRFHEAKYSRDVLDFALVLSPSDMWTAVVEERNGGPGVRPTDNSCTVPIIGSGNFKAFDPDATGIPVDDMREGYVEIIQEGAPDPEAAADTDAAKFAAAAKHVHIDDVSDIPASCSTVENYFVDAGIQDILTVYPTNVLAGKYDLINVNAATASTSAARAVVIQDFNDAPLAYPQVSNQEDLPNLACATAGQNPATCDDVTPVETALGATAISNEWVLNPGLGELSSWVITFPTKALNTDPDITGTDGIFVDDPARCGTFDGDPLPWIPVKVTLDNREEKTKSGVSFSPAFNGLCYETNVINFTSTQASSATLLSSGVSKTLNVDGLKTPFLGGCAQIAHATADTILPGVGFNLTARTKLGDAVLYDHFYEGR